VYLLELYRERFCSQFFPKSKKMGHKSLVLDCAFICSVINLLSLLRFL